MGVVMDGLRRGEEISYFSSTIELLVLFGSIFWETFFLAEVSILLYVFPFSVPYQLIVRCIVIFLHRLPSFFLVSPSIPFFRFHLALPYEIVGGCWYYRRYPKYSRPLFSSIPPYRVARDSGT